MKLIKGDKVMIMKGKDRGKAGKVLRALPQTGRVTVEGLNLLKKTVRPRRQGEKGQIVEVPGPMRAENVQLVCSSCNKPTRIGSKIEDTRKKRYCKKCKATI